MNDGFQSTEFNSSVACLMRIDDLIQGLHKARLNLFPVRNNRAMFCDCLYGLWVETRAKLDKKEQHQCLTLITEMDDVKVRYGKTMLVETTNNRLRYEQGWAEITAMAQEFELLIMELLDKHGMLMSNKRDFDITDF